MNISTVLDFDTHLLLLVNHARSPFFDWIMPILSDFRMLIPVLVPLLAWRLWKGDRRERLLWIGAVAAVGISDMLCARVIKELIARPRPYEVLDGLHVLKHSKWLVTDAAFRQAISGTLAWPSCHSMNMWTAATYLVLWWRKRAVPVVILAILVCWSRMYLGVHYPLDVAGGALIGTLLGFTAWKTAGFIADYRINSQNIF